MTYDFIVSLASEAAHQRARQYGLDITPEILRVHEHAYRVATRSNALSEAFAELEDILHELKNTVRIRHIRVLLKLYVINWVTLSDVAANLINDTFDLGYSEKDVSFGAIMRNRHVASTDLPSLVKKHARALRHDEFSRLRNEIVHRGVLHDDAFQALELQLIMSLLTSRADHNPKNAAAAATSEAFVDAELAAATQAYITAKTSELAPHVDATRAFLVNLDSLLAGVIATTP